MSSADQSAHSMRMPPLTDQSEHRSALVSPVARVACPGTDIYLLRCFAMLPTTVFNSGFILAFIL